MAYEMRIGDWSSDVCSSDLPIAAIRPSFTATSAAAMPLGVATTPPLRIRSKFSATFISFRDWTLGLAVPTPRGKALEQLQIPGDRDRLGEIGLVGRPAPGAQPPGQAGTGNTPAPPGRQGDTAAT